MNLNANVESQFNIFLQFVPAKRLNMNLRRILIGYLRREIQFEQGMPEFMDLLLQDLDTLFDFLDVIDQYCDQPKE